MSEVSIETRKYLDHIARRVEAYHKIRLRTLDYLEQQGVTNTQTAANCVIMAILWLSAVRQDRITENELLIHLGLDDTLTEDKEMLLDPEIAEMGFDEALDYCLLNMEDDDD